MHTTPLSLLERLHSVADQAAWERFVQLYPPLLYYWAWRLGLHSQDAADLVQDVLTILVRKLPEFEYDRARSFRSWLRTLTLNHWRNSRRRQPIPSVNLPEKELPDRDTPDAADAFAEVEYQKHLVGRALELMRAEFQPNTWKACWEHVVNDRPATEVAAELGMTKGAVYVAKCRVLRRLRRELKGLLD
jgi:RNA polymerase sigma-70 factor (ECF subfamily)